MAYTIETTELIAQPAAVVRAEVSHSGIGEFLGRAFGQVMGTLATLGMPMAGPPFARYDFHGEGFLVEAGFPTMEAMAVVVDDTSEVQGIELPAGLAAVTMHVGPYAEVSGVYKAIEAWLSDNGYVPAGAPWESYLDGPEVAAPRTIVTWPCLLVTAH